MVKTLLTSFILLSLAFMSFGQDSELQVKFESLLKKSDTTSRVYIDKEGGYWEIKQTLPAGEEVGFRIPYKDMTFKYSKKSIGRKKSGSHFVKMSCPTSIPCFMNSSGTSFGVSAYWQLFKSKVDAIKFIKLMDELKGN